jgi:hypothetical protein
VSKIHLGVPLLVYFLAAATPAAKAQDADVVGRLTKHGGLNKRDARSLVGEVSRKMQKAARAMRIAVFGAVSTGPQQDVVNDAKARLYLYAGLNGRALALLFRPGPTAVSGCMGSFRLGQYQCEALVAAAAQRPVAEIRQQQSARQQMPATYGAAQPAFPARPVPAQTYRPAVPARPVQQPVARPMPVQRPVARPAPARPPPGPNAATAAAYKARREAYLAKYKEKMKKKKGPPPAAPAPEPVPAAEPAPAAAPAAAAAAPAAAPAAAAKPKKKKAEPDPLIDGLLSDPLGKSK